MYTLSIQSEEVTGSNYSQPYRSPTKTTFGLCFQFWFPKPTIYLLSSAPFSSSLPPSLPPLTSAGLRDAFFETTFQQMFVEGRRSGRDDLLFYVKYDVNEDKDTVDVLRSDSRTLPTWVANFVEKVSSQRYLGVLYVNSLVCLLGSLKHFWAAITVLCHYVCVLGVVDLFALPFYLVTKTCIYSAWSWAV